MREPDPPARMRKPVLPNPVNSSEVEEDWSEVEEEEVVAVTVLESGGRERMALLDAAGRNAAANGSNTKN